MLRCQVPKITHAPQAEKQSHKCLRTIGLYHTIVERTAWYAEIKYSEDNHHNPCGPCFGGCFQVRRHVLQRVFCQYMAPCFVSQDVASAQKPSLPWASGQKHAKVSGARFDCQYDHTPRLDPELYRHFFGDSGACIDVLVLDACSLLTHEGDEMVGGWPEPNPDSPCQCHPEPLLAGALTCKMVPWQAGLAAKFWEATRCMHYPPHSLQCPGHRPLGKVDLNQLADIIGAKAKAKCLGNLKRG